MRFDLFDAEFSFPLESYTTWSNYVPEIEYGGNRQYRTHVLNFTIALVARDCL